MKILLRHLGGFDDGSRKEEVELAGVPRRDDEIHWPDRILRVIKVMWFPSEGNPHEHAACLYVETLS